MKTEQVSKLKGHAITTVNSRAVNVLRRVASQKELAQMEVKPDKEIRGVTLAQVRETIADIYYLSEEGKVPEESVRPLREAFHNTLVEKGVGTRAEAMRAREVLRLRGWRHKIEDPTADSYWSILGEGRPEWPKISNLVSVVLAGGNGVEFQRKAPTHSRMNTTTPTPDKIERLLFSEDGSIEEYELQQKARVSAGLKTLGINSREELIKSQFSYLSIMNALRPQFGERGTMRGNPDHELFLDSLKAISSERLDDEGAEERRLKERLASYAFGPTEV